MKSSEDFHTSRGGETTHLSEITMMSPKSTINSLMRRSHVIMLQEKEANNQAKEEPAQQQEQEVEIVKKKRVKRYKRKPTVKRILNPYEESVFTFQEI